MNKLIHTVFIAALGVILFTTILIPIINDGVNGASDKINHTNADTAPFVESATEYTYSASTVETIINGEAATMPAYTQVITTDNGVLYHISGNTYSLFLPSQDVSRFITLSDTVTINATLNGATLTIVAGTDTYTESVDTAYVFVGGSSGDTAVSNSYTTFTTNPGTKGLITLGDGYYSVKSGVALIEDWSAGEATLYYYTFTSNGVIGTESSEKVTWTVTDNYDGSITISDIVSENGTITGISPHRLLYENEYYTYGANATSSLIGVIPIIVIVGFIAGIVGVVAVRRFD